MHISKKSSTFATSIKNNSKSIFNILAIRFNSQTKHAAKLQKIFNTNKLKF